MASVYELRDAAEKIEGYLISRPTDKDGDAFERAKTECLKNIRKHMDVVEQMTLDQFRRCFKPHQLPAA